MIPVLENHDVKCSSSAQVLQSLLDLEWKMPNYSYFFYKEPVHFHGINSNCHLYAWYRLYRDLSGKEEQKGNYLRQQARWTVVFGHHPVYSNGVHGDSGLIQRLIWEILFGEHVDFYLSGHDHQLAHLSRERKRTQYLVSGAGGAHYRDPEQKKNLKDSADRSHFTHHDNGFLWMERVSAHTDVQSELSDLRDLCQRIPVTSSRADPGQMLAVAGTPLWLLCDSNAHIQLCPLRHLLASLYTL